MTDYILGLDLGPNSIGWALVSANFEDGEPIEVGLLDTSGAGHSPLGVRIFEEGVANYGTTKEMSLSQERRTKRSIRRLLARRRARKEHLRRFLQGVGLLPVDTSALAEVVATDPYRLRAEGLHRALAPFEFGRALFHLAQRRGFKSNRKSGRANAADERKTLKEMSELSEAIRASGAHTLGEYLYRESLRGMQRDSQEELPAVYRGQVRLRARFVRQDEFSQWPRRARRDHYIDEFHKLLSAQRTLTGTPILTPEQEKRVFDSIFYQRPFEVTEERRAQAPPCANLHRAPHLKPCPLEPGERRARKSDWIAQRFRILKEVNNLRIMDEGWKERALQADERRCLVDLLSEQKEVKFGKMRRELRLSESSCFNLERGGREKIDGNQLDAALASAVGKKRWRDFGDGERIMLRDKIENTEDEEDLKSALAAMDIPEAGIEKLLSLTPGDSYMAFSRKALARIIRHMELGRSEFEAIALEYPEKGEAKTWAELPSLVAPGVPPEIASITNPVVRRALVEVRKVVNALIRVHGRPRRIVVELAREMHAGAHERSERASEMREREKQRDDARNRASEILGGARAGREEVSRYLMWKQQGTFCLYTGRPIPQTTLFSNEVEVDHILPRWASLDDSRANKVLCFATANGAKGQRTPAEWLGVDSKQYRLILALAEEQCRDQGLPWGVLSRLRMVSVDSEGFVARQLNDTRYISRLVAKYLGLLFSPEDRAGQKAILTTRGSLTAELRYQWGLNDVLDPILDAHAKPLPDHEESGARRKKLRVDHRHHAIDAFVVALSSRSRLRRYQRWWQQFASEQARLNHDRPRFLAAWDRLREDVKRASSEILVSHRVTRKIAGALHKDTFYGSVRNSSGQIIEGVYVTRKPLEALTLDIISDNGGRTGIVDTQVRNAIVARLKNMGWREGESLPKDWWRQEIQLRSGVPVRRVRVRVAIGDPVELANRFAASAGNHHLAFEPMTAGETRLLARVRTMSDVASSVRRGGERLFQPDTRHPNKEFPVARTLARNEVVSLVSPDSNEQYYAVVQKVSGPRRPSTGMDVTLRDIRDGRPASSGNRDPLKRFKSSSALLEWSARKVQIDLLGRVYPAGD